DGFPIYGPYGYRDANNPAGGMTELRTSHRVKQGTRPSGLGGRYDGTYVQDYEFAAGLGDLDMCNGRDGVTPEYPEGRYY
ncbi:MAG: YHYH protein, partial [Rhodospirillaceae bacterium]